MNFQLLKFLKKFFTNFLNSVYPPRCMSCNANVSSCHQFCEKCWSKIEFISEPYCHKCGLPHPVHYLSNKDCESCNKLKPRFNQCKSVFRYSAVTNKLIKKFKFHDTTIYGQSFAQLIFKSARSLVEASDFLIAVPMYKKDLKVRKYNHAFLIARALSKLASKKLLPDTLIKHRQSLSQSGLTRSERLKNLEKAFSIAKNHDLIKGKNILLIDDVMTTGTTLNECSKVLKRAGAKRVIVLTVARSY